MGNYIEIEMYPDGDYVIIKDTALKVINQLADSCDGDHSVDSKRHDTPELLHKTMKGSMK